MPTPTPNQVHLDAVLTNISVAFLQTQDAFVAPKVFPLLPVEKQSDTYLTYDRSDWLRDEAAPRADGTESAGSGYNIDRDTYACLVTAFHKDIGDQAAANADAPLNLDREATEFVTRKLLLRLERDWASKYFTAGVWGIDLDGSGADFDQFDDSASDPMNLVEDQKETVLELTGFELNTAVLSYPAFRALKNHPDIVDRLKYSGEFTGRTVTADKLAEMFDLERVLIAKSIFDSAQRGATSDPGFVHGKHMLLAYVPDTPSTLTPSAGYTFAWSGVSSGLGAETGISRFRMEERKADRVEGEAAWDHKVVAPDLGVFLQNVVG